MKYARSEKSNRITYLLDWQKVLLCNIIYNKVKTFIYRHYIPVSHLVPTCIPTLSFPVLSWVIFNVIATANIHVVFFLSIYHNKSHLKCAVMPALDHNMQKLTPACLPLYLRLHSGCTRIHLPISNVSAFVECLCNIQLSSFKCDFYADCQLSRVVIKMLNTLI